MLSILQLHIRVCVPDSGILASNTETNIRWNMCLTQIYSSLMLYAHIRTIVQKNRKHNLKLHKSGKITSFRITYHPILIQKIIDQTHQNKWFIEDNDPKILLNRCYRFQHAYIVWVFNQVNTKWDTAIPLTKRQVKIKHFNKSFWFFTLFFLDNFINVHYTFAFVNFWRLATSNCRGKLMHPLLVESSAANNIVFEAENADGRRNGEFNLMTVS